MEELSFKTENFEGPLDLLLHLVAKHKMQLSDIKILVLIDQYMSYMGELTPEQLDSASEFVEMAARLVHMKSAFLLPRQQEAEELTRELVGQLVEYQLCKKMAARLADMAEGVYLVVREPLEIELSQEYKGSHRPGELLAAYMSMMGKNVRLAPPRQRDFDELVTVPVVSVTSRVIHILRGLKRGVVSRLQDLFEGSRSHSEAVATFLGLLELMKVRRVTVAEDGLLSLASGRGRPQTTNNSGEPT